MGGVSQKVYDPLFCRVETAERNHSRQKYSLVLKPQTSGSSYILL